MNRTINIKNYLLLLLLVFITSCVGTVEEGKTPTTSYSEPKQVTFSFKGIQDARAISGSRVEVEFKPSSKSSVAYRLHTNGDEGVELNTEDLKKSVGGKVTYTVRGLSLAETYKFKVTAKDFDTGEVSDNEKEITVKTFNTWTSDFDGIQDAVLVPGRSDTSVKISWYNPSPEGTFSPIDQDPRLYEVTIVKDSEGGPSLLKEVTTDKTKVYRFLKIPSLSAELGGKTVLGDPAEWPEEAIISNLEPDTKYYIRMRAVHETWYSKYKTEEGTTAAQTVPHDDTIVPFERERNTIFMEIKTDSPLDPASIDVAGLSTVAPPGVEGYEEVKVSWIQATGLYDKYRLLVKKLPTGTINPSVAIQAEELIDDTYLAQFQADLDTNAKSCTSTSNIDVSKEWGCLDISTEKTSYVVKGLDPKNYYQFRLVVCTDLDCKLSGGTNPPIITNKSWVYTSAKIPPFGGIKFINNPKDGSLIASSGLSIDIDFDPPAKSTGYLSEMELHCINHTDIQNNVDDFQTTKIDPSTGTPVTSGVGNCDDITDLEYDTTSFKWGGTLKASDYTKNILLKGVKAINSAGETYGSTRYCFALVPAIRDKGAPDLVMAKEDWIVRCINPQVQVPTIEQFAGLKNKCNLELDPGTDSYQVTLEWGTPSDGIYNAFQVLSKRMEEGENFDYDEFFDNSVTVNNLPVGNSVESGSINNTIKYEKSSYQTANQTSMVIKKLKPGYTYNFAVLAVLDVATGTDFFSEYNTGIISCEIPMPTARFNEWTRVFAVGPKIDGTIPKNNPYHSFQNEAYIFEALNRDGLPYDVILDGTGAPDSATLYNAPPGNYDDTSAFDYTTTIDGRGRDVNGTTYYASNKGVVSLSWRDVTLEYMGTTFASEQDHGTRGSRKYGYKVYRSDDNKLSWREVTDESGLLHSKVFTYYKGQNGDEVTDQKMVFFTDYSVDYQNSTDQYEYARTYWYKIVPVFDDVELNYEVDDKYGNIEHNTIKVILPPANMALVNRLMANRRACMDMDTSSAGSFSIHSGTIPNPFYTCAFNGLGNRPNPTTNDWKESDTGRFIDQGGDLLVDRYELGCNFTRGSRTADYSSGRSVFDPNFVKDEGGSVYDLNLGNELQSHVSEFIGKNSSSSVGENANDFVGCVSSHHSGNASSGNNPNNYSNATMISNHGDNSNVANHYHKSIWGDCTVKQLGSAEVWDSTSCPSTRSPRAWYGLGLWDINANNSADPDCTASTATQPTILADFRGPEIQRHYTTQAEHLAVMYSQTQINSSRQISPYGANNQQIINFNYTRPDSCFINIASIGTKAGDPGDGSNTGQNWWRSRWVGVNNSENSASTTSGLRLDDNKHFFEQTVSEIHSDTNLYDTNYYKNPLGPGNHTDPINGRTRYESNTKIGQIFSSNSAHLPPLKSLELENAQTLCGVREVKVGFSVNGSFNPYTAPLKKRLPRRTEFIAMAAWPNNSEVPALFDKHDMSWSGANIALIERGAETGDYQRMCKGSNLPATLGQDLWVNQVIRSIHAGANDTTVVEPLFTGSSQAFDSFDANTEMCKSDYGIQDLAGNVAELTAETLDCNFAVDSLYYGPHNGNSYRNEGSGDTNSSIDLTKDVVGVISGDTKLLFDGTSFTNGVAANLENTYQWSSNSQYSWDAGESVCKDNNQNKYPNISQAQCGQPSRGIFTSTGTINGSLSSNDFWIKQNAPIVFRNNDGTVDTTRSQTGSNLQLFTVQQAGSGFCALGTDNASLYSSMSQYRTSSTFNPVNLFDGSLNSSMITSASTVNDNGIFEFARDGDGVFLNLGPKHLVSRLNVSDTLNIAATAKDNGAKTLTTEQGNGRFFNPIYGLPITCGENTVGSDCGESDDNKAFALTKETDGSDITSEFHFGNSQINNSGISSFTWNTLANSSGLDNGFFNYSFGATYRARSTGYIDRFDVYTDANGRDVVVAHVVDHQEGVYVYASDDQSGASFDGNTIKFTSSFFDVPRSSQLAFINGGGVNRNPAGRFSLDINSIRGGVINSGFRCMIKVEE